MPIAHLGITVTNLVASKAFYLAALKPLGYEQKMSFRDDKVLGLGVGYNVDFWLTALDVKNSNPEAAQGVATGPMHLAFGAASRKEVDEFHKVALAAGAKCNGPPGLREHYAPNYYGAFVLDPEGRNIEAVCMNAE